MSEHERLRDEVLRRVGVFLTAEDKSVLLEPAAERAATALRESAQATFEGIPSMDVQDGLTLGLFYWFRSKVQPPAAAARDREEYMLYFRGLMATAPEYVPDEVREEILRDPSERRGLDVLEQLSLMARAEETYNKARADRDLTLLDESIVLTTRLVDLDPLGEDAPHFFAALSHRLRDRYEWADDSDNLDAAIHAAHMAVMTAAPAATTEAEYWPLLDSLVALRFERTSDPMHLDYLVEVRRARVAASPDGSDDVRLRLAESLVRRFDERADSDDLREAARHLRLGAVEAEPQALVLRFVLLQSCYSHDNALVDESALIEAGRAALDRLPADDSRVPGLKCNAAPFLLGRYEKHGRSGDLADALTLAHEAVEALSEDDEGQALARGVFARALVCRHEQVVRTSLAAGYGIASISDLDWALHHLRRCIELTPPGHPRRYNVFDDLGDALRRGADTENRPELLTEAIDAHRMALKAATVPAQRVESLRKCALALQNRYRASEVEADLDEAIELCRRAVAMASPGSYEGRLARLGLAEKLAFKVLRHPEREDDRRWVMEVYRDISGDEEVGFRARMSAARSWGRIMHQAGRYDEALKGYDAMLALMPEVVPLELAEADRLRLAEEWGITPTIAATCGIAAGRLEKAIELVEGVRMLTAPGVGTAAASAEELRRRRPDLAAQVDAAHEAAADSFQEHDASFLPAGISVVTKNTEERCLRRDEGARTWRRTLAQIREVPGFEGFLAPAGFDELCRAADRGPVAVPLASPDRCDVLLLTRDGADVLPLRVTMDAVADYVDRYRGVLNALGPVPPSLQQHAMVEDDLAQILRWLWRGTVRPTLDRLGLLTHADPDSPYEWPHLWWSPCGLFSHFPLHAAGESPEDGAMDYVMSSYAPSLRLLAHLNTGLVHEELQARAPRLLAVGLCDTPQLANSSLPHVPKEVAAVSRMFPEGRRTVLTDAEATVSAVEEALPRHHWLHFACHARQNPRNPSSSQLYLHDGPLTVSKVRRHDLRNSRLAVMSACETATSGITLMDEGLYLGGAMHVAGCPDVVATLWTIADSSAAQVTERLYAHLLRNGEPDAEQVATALHLAVHGLRAQAPDLYSSWAPFVHIGAGR
ncbi:CHAT domain-containing protein [Streptomyces sp. NPDC050315]|uniref:CHAT domain-containing protein n=1 Tax=Streptomyces sp. NPDC050315 TaxID=3155039 RepID=UPI00343788BB